MRNNYHFSGTTARCFGGAGLFGLLHLAPMLPVNAQALGITGFAPSVNAVAVVRTSPVEVMFNQPLVAGATALKVYSAQRGGLRTAAVAPTIAGNRLTFAPTNYSYMPGETVFATVTTAVTGAGGALAQGKTVQFTAAVGGPGQGTFVVPPTNPNPGLLGDGSVAVLGDMDGDGDLDALALSQGNVNTVNCLLNDGKGNLMYSSFTTLRPTATDLVVGDLDGDGDLDFVTINGGRTNLFYNDGSGLFSNSSPSTDPGFNSGSYKLALGDMDGDGDLDMLSPSRDFNSVAVRLNTGSGVFNTASGPSVNVGAKPYDVAVGDVDGDGDLDIVTVNAIDASVSIRLNGGDASGSNNAAFSNGSTCAVGGSPQSVVLGDVDGDGDLDLLTANNATNNVSVRLNNGAGVFTAPQANAEVAVGNQVADVMLGDLDSDGDLDFVTVNARAGISGVTVRFNNGTGSFTARDADYAVSGIAGSISLGDIDGDGDLDFVAANTPGLSVRLNEQTRLATTAGRSVPFSSFPNPARATVAVTGAAAGSAIVLSDALGRVLLVAVADAKGSAQLTLPVTLTAGIYWLRCGEQIRRLAVE